MREIKFRAWDKTRGCWQWGNTNNLMICLGGLKMWQFAMNPPEPVENQDDFILCQYTGLKDKNGKEIYEGDIVKFGSQYLSTNEVKFLESNAGYLVKDKWGDWQWLYDVCGSTNIEVIGNRFENPELLKD